MSKTRIFVSSTCYDLAATREDIRNCIIGLGHEPWLSEYPSFPCLPELKTIDNCKKVVRDKTDIFILIIGGKRGSLDPDTGKPITNIEYEAAKENNIDSFIFVYKPVMDLLSIWEKNPDADFSPSVDYPVVFKFIKDIMAEQKWIFPFEKTSEIKEIIKNQLSIYLSYLIQKKKEGKLIPLKEFLNESEKAQRIALEKPDYWEYLLTVELLSSKLEPVYRNFSDLERGLSFKKSQNMNKKDFLNFIKSKFDDIVALVKLLKTTIEEEIPFSWGKPGEPGNCFEIKRATDKIIMACTELFEWEFDIVFTHPPDALNKLKQTLIGTTKQIISGIRKIRTDLDKVFQEEDPKGHRRIGFTFKDPPNIEAFHMEYYRLIKEGIIE